MPTWHEVGFNGGMSTALAARNASQIKTEVRTIKKAGGEINKSTKSARQFLRKNGFITKGNKLTKQYR